MKHFIARINKSGGFTTEWLTGHQSWSEQRPQAQGFNAQSAALIHDKLKEQGITAFILSESPHTNPQQCFDL